ncbi:hypothetical protein V0288_01595 [Pannus brasiliensis CCIBt3594]|uniref:Uncharacterized protein n=1 Tax=Pannus brasiliensis CCIBt3594 TaxID=1427578 RepID=A0AAW9QR82_9CHRO
MNFPESPDRDNPYTAVEVEIEPNDAPPPDPSERFAPLLTKLKAWYSELPVPARVAVAVVGAFLALSTLTAILRLVSAVLSVLILGAIFLLIYRYALKPGKT